MSDSVLVIGSGGREHVLAWKLSQSSSVKQVFVAPGNAGTDNTPKTSNVGLNVKDFEEVTKWCQEKSINLVVVGPEDPLAAGISDYLNSQGVLCFGPSSEAAQIESSKEFAKNFMTRHNIPTATFQCFTEVQEALNYISKSTHKSLVVKASGLAAGKGVIVASSKDEASAAVKRIMTDKQFGKAGDKVIIEEYLEGDEVSVLAFTDGTNIAVLPPVQDHKRLLEGDQGPNTGGMGAYCPYPKLNGDQLNNIKSSILQKAVDGLRAEGIPFKGLLYAGLMLTDKGPKVLEFNCRFGDPEIQSILPLMTSDFYEVCKSCVEGTLDKHIPVFESQKKAVGVVVVSGGYPGSYKKGLPIAGLEKIKDMGLLVFHAGTSQTDMQIVTNGGRVLAVVSVDNDFHRARNKALQGASLVEFVDSFYRKDIGYRLCNSVIPVVELSYKDSGVDIDAGNSLVEAIKPLAKATRRQGCDAAIGSFGGLFDLKAAGYSDPLLVSGTDGVGTKLKVASLVGKHDSVGVDLVAMCVNDILAHGAEPLFFLDYFATGKLNVSMTTDVIAGISKGCLEAGCALIGGETAEMPGMYSHGDYDIAGFTVGAVERDMLLPRLQDIVEGDVVIGLPSSGIHSNGFSLVRKIVERLDLRYDMPSPFKTENTLGEDLLVPTKIYVKTVLPLIKLGLVKAFAHITGGGLTENIPRILPESSAVNLNANLWKIPPVFGWLKQKGHIADCEMVRTYNCGIGGVLIVNKSKVEDILKPIHETDTEASVIGHVVHKNESERVKIENLGSSLEHSWKRVPGVSKKKKVAVLISGSGTNLQALIDHTHDPSQSSVAEISLVISNKPSVFGLERAQRAGIITEVVNHKDYKDREAFDNALHERLIAHQIDIVCLAGFMRILTGNFVRKWNGRMLNVHPSLLPSFKGANAHKLVIESKVRISGCTVHFVAEEVDGGAILVQQSVPVYPRDTEDTLSERVKEVEHVAFPKALELVASERAVLGENGVIEWF